MMGVSWANIPSLTSWPSWPACSVFSCPCLCFPNPSRPWHTTDTIGVNCLFNCDPLMLFIDTNTHIFILGSSAFFIKGSKWYPWSSWVLSGLFSLQSQPNPFSIGHHLYESCWIHTNLQKMGWPRCIPVHFPLTCVQQCQYHQRSSGGDSSLFHEVQSVQGEGESSMPEGLPHHTQPHQTYSHQASHSVVYWQGGWKVINRLQCPPHQF